MNEMILIKEQSMRQAIREALADAKLHDNDASYFETMIMRRVKDYMIQPIELTEEAKAMLCRISLQPEPYVASSRR